MRGVDMSVVSREAPTLALAQEDTVEVSACCALRLRMPHTDKLLVFITSSTVSGRVLCLATPLLCIAPASMFVRGDDADVMLRVEKRVLLRV